MSLREAFDAVCIAVGVLGAIASGVFGVAWALFGVPMGGP
jgi:hypothetical protein